MPSLDPAGQNLPWAQLLQAPATQPERAWERQRARARDRERERVPGPRGQHLVKLPLPVQDRCWHQNFGLQSVLSAPLPAVSTGLRSHLPSL